MGHVSGFSVFMSKDRYVRMAFYVYVILFCKGFMLIINISSNVDSIKMARHFFKYT